MERSIPSTFYKTKRWLKVRAVYLSEHPYCERCLAAGIVKPAEHVHHRIHLTKDNYTDPAIAYGADNLEALCQDCHNREHFGNSDVSEGTYFDAEGNLRQRGGASEGN